MNYLSDALANIAICINAEILSNEVFRSPFARLKSAAHISKDNKNAASLRVLILTMRINGKC